MIPNSTVGPPAQGIPGLPAKEAGQKPREESSGSFAKTLAGKDKPKADNAIPKRREDSHRAKSEKNEHDDHPRAELRKEQDAPPGKKRELSAREAAITKFMDSFESEFEIPPTEMVEAMAHLEQKDLAQSPEATAEKVVNKLGLDEADEEKAQAMYASLLTNLRQIDQAKPVATADAQERSGAAASAGVIGQEQRAKMNDALEQLTQKFWETKMTKGDQGADGKAEALSSRFDVAGLAGLGKAQDLSKLSIDEASFDADDLDLGDALDGEFEAAGSDVADDVEMPESDEIAQDAVSAESLAANTANVANRKATSADESESIREFENQGDDQTYANKISAKGKNGGDGKTEATGPAGAQIVQSKTDARGQGKASQDFLGQSKSANAGKSADKAAKEASVEGGTSFKAALDASAMPKPLKLEDVAAALKNNAAAATVPANVPKDHAAEVQQLINQAQILIKKGGGEMKVQMSPEGMGQIDLKVALKDGKVQLQMATETPEAKKLIESSMADLRSSLAAHKLTVEHVKVDVVAGPHTENQARNETNLNQGQERQGTRQFWNQFQENFGNRGAREGFLEMPDMKAYRQAVRPTPLQPLDVNGPSAARTMGEVGKGRGLNLVA